MKMITVAPHHRFVQPMLAFYISFGVGRYCFIHAKAMREAVLQDKADIVPTPFFIICLLRGIKGLKKLKDMSFSNIFFLLILFLAVPVVAIISAKDDSEETGGCATVGMLVIAAIIALIIVIAL